jgi:beta-lactam-binding protein with PASTA domain/tRNA A-37 threonylcarbamoyl transferase component Bud32
MTQVANVFSNRYELQHEVARGGMALVYLARDQLLDRPVAVKMLFPEFARDPSFVERFRREAHAAANLNHPNIVAIYDWGQERGTYFIVMEYVEGQSLRELIRADGPLPPQQAAEIAAEIAGALAFAHRNGVVHRDVKPGNVLLTPSRRVKVTDFGIARAGAAEALTQTGAVMGTATYFSPEQAQGHPVDGRSDVYSLGVVLYETVTGVPPFEGDTPVAVAYKHVREDPTPPSQRNPDVPPDLERIILATLVKDADARYQSADDLRDDLVRFGRGRPPSAAPVTAMVTDVPSGETAGATQAMPAATAVDDEGFYEPPRPDRGRIVGGIVAGILGVGLVVFLILILAGFFSRDATSGEKIAVPGVVGQQFDEAKATLKDAGFEVKRVDEESAKPTGEVLQQEPPEGQKLEKGKTVTLTVSAEVVTIPNVVGKQEAEARTQLQQLGLTNIASFPRESDQPAGTVLDTRPPVGSEVNKSDQVVLIVASEAAVTIPAVANLPQAQAEQNLRDAGFQVTVQQRADAVITMGRAIATDPPEGSKHPRGSSVTLFVSSGPEQVDVPNVKTMTQQQAEQTLLSAQFNVIVTYAPGSSGQEGTVIAQSPDGGQAPRGSTVTIVVAQ